MKHVNAEAIPLWLSIPFVVMLLFIAVGPLLFNHWWEDNKNKLKVSLALGLPLSVVLFMRGLHHELMHQIVFDYVPFIILLGALFIITGGIHLKGDIEAKPGTNTVFLTIGALLASFMGTTGAAMLLIRPIIRTNQQRVFKVHTILFFIAIVANAGGMLTPLGDPPLFLLYLRGAPFMWFFGLFGPWLFVNSILLIVYYFTDRYYHAKEPVVAVVKDHQQIEPISIHGKVNFVYLSGVIAAVAFLNAQFIPAIHDNHYIGFIREGVILVMAILSLVTSNKELRYFHNKFSWGPIVEVAYLFIGIFITMVPALLYLKQNAHSFGISSPAMFFGATGGLSAFLDNAPTAVSFHNLALGMAGQFSGAQLVAGVPEIILKAICLGAVFFGAMTYIGNGPNFMVKAIAEENNITMPSFFGYIFRFSLIVLLPVYIITQILFLSMNIG